MRIPLTLAVLASLALPLSAPAQGTGPQPAAAPRPAVPDTFTSETVASPNGRLKAVLAKAQGPGDTPWRAITLTGPNVSEQLKWAAYTKVAWARDNSGVYYSRFPEPPPAGTTSFFGGVHDVYFHRIGTPQSADILVYESDRFRTYHTAEMSTDGKWLVITTSLDHQPKHEIVLIDQTSAIAAPWKLIRDLQNAWWFAGSKGDVLYFVTDFGATRGRVVSIDVNKTAFAVKEVVPEAADTLKGAKLTPKGLVLDYGSRTQTVTLSEAAS